MRYLTKRLAAAVLSAAILVIWSACALAAAPDITADAAIVVNEQTGEVLYEKNADKREYPASMTKMMTCILALERTSPDQIVTVSDNAADVECTRLYPGYELRMADMLQQMMMISDNGAATAVGEAVAGDIDSFAALMNEKAAALGATDTHFVNANGMPDSNHYSTARDMAKIASYGMKMPAFRKIVGTEAKNIYYIRPAGHTAYCENTNELLDTYPGCTGVKTGWTRAARGCLTAAAKRGDTELLVVVMHSDSDDTRFSEAAALLDYGFSELQQNQQAPAASKAA
ncbi:D-alanyl-D-alanine carboxypeptidase family protein [uncultured Mitsuokella sp.]|uniref:D-alanyl-D-alanine carboxypeptidase family protein n=1 Tax=uncultured Mitsuokella sp. TaxID=453120 RepID=UPI00263179C5|nr:D-alanyl-D-alanine carboxypeptidase family protein [uncultured Mitsuokella sp.]